MDKFFFMLMPSVSSSCLIFLIFIKVMLGTYDEYSSTTDRPLCWGRIHIHTLWQSSGMESLVG